MQLRGRYRISTKNGIDSMELIRPKRYNTGGF